MGKSKREGFTLVEMMLVIGIIGILASVAVPTFSKYKESVRDAEATQMLSALHNGAISYFSQEFVFSSAAGANTGTQCTVRPGVVPDFTTVVAVQPDGTKFNLDFSADAAFETSWKELGLDATGYYYHAYNVVSAGRCYQTNAGDAPASTGETMYILMAIRKAPLEGGYQIGIVHEAYMNASLMKSGGVNWYREITESGVSGILANYNPPTSSSSSSSSNSSSSSSSSSGSSTSSSSSGGP